MAKVDRSIQTPKRKQTPFHTPSTILDLGYVAMWPALSEYPGGTRLVFKNDSNSILNRACHSSAQACYSSK